MPRINCSAPNIVNAQKLVKVSPFGQFKVAIETKYSTAPFKGMRSTGKNGFYYCFESIHAYSEQLALKLRATVDKSSEVTNSTIYVA